MSKLRQENVDFGQPWCFHDRRNDHHSRGSPTMSERHQDGDSSRREFLQTSAAAGIALGLAGAGESAEERGVPTRPLGKTGVNVSMICLGGWHIGSVKEKKEAVKSMHTALD